LPVRCAGQYMKMADIEEEAIRHYFSMNYEYNTILDFLERRHGIKISKRTLLNRLKVYSLCRRGRAVASTTNFCFHRVCCVFTVCVVFSLCVLCCQISVLSDKCVVLSDKCVVFCTYGPPYEYVYLYMYVIHIDLNLNLTPNLYLNMYV
jgi:hypothetical protein